MRLIDYMVQHGMGDGDFASAFNDGLPAEMRVTVAAVKKWKYGERQPPLERVARIEEITNGQVQLRDFLREVA